MFLQSQRYCGPQSRLLATSEGKTEAAGQPLQGQTDVQVTRRRSEWQILLCRGKSWRQPGEAEDMCRDEGDINTPAESYKDGRTKNFIPNNLSAFN